MIFFHCVKVQLFACWLYSKGSVGLYILNVLLNLALRTSQLSVFAAHLSLPNVSPSLARRLPFVSRPLRLRSQVELSPLVSVPLLRVHLTCGLGPQRHNSAAHGKGPSRQHFSWSKAAETEGGEGNECQPY